MSDHFTTLRSKGLNTKTTDEIFQQSGKQVCFRHILKISACMNEILDSQPFKITTGIYSGPSPFEKSTLVMTFLTNLGVTETSSLKLVLERKKVNRFLSPQDYIISLCQI